MQANWTSRATVSRAPSCGSEDGSPSSSAADRYTALSAASEGFLERPFCPVRAICLAVYESLGLEVALEGAWSLKTQQFGDLSGVRRIPD